MIITYYSISGNTKKICEYLGKELNIPVKELYEVNKPDNFVVLGFPVHFSKPPKFVIRKLKSFDLNGKKFFVIITYGLPYLGKITAISAYKIIKRLIEEKGGIVVGKFMCPGRHTMIRFLNRGRPNEKDLKEALKALNNSLCLSH